MLRGMTNSEALEIITNAIQTDKITVEQDMALAIAQTALKKQMPKKLDYEGDGYDDNGEIIYDTAFCCNCRHEFEVYYDDHCKYCPDCGQALDWSDK